MQPDYAQSLGKKPGARRLRQHFAPDASVYRRSAARRWAPLGYRHGAAAVQAFSQDVSGQPPPNWSAAVPTTTTRASAGGLIGIARIALPML